MSKMFMNVKEVMEVLEVSESYAYKLMKRLNRELQAMGCQKAQGYYFARPMPLSEWPDIGKTLP